MKIKKHIGATFESTLTSLTLLLLMACSPRPVPDPAAADVPAASWQCRNDLEVHCGDGACEVEAEDAFTPMSVRVDDSGAMSVCAYSGCWEGAGKVVHNQGFVVLVGYGLKFSTAPDSESANADVVLAIDRKDGVATLKVGGFALPLLCEVTSPDRR